VTGTNQEADTMDDARAAILGEIAAEAGVERASFLTDAAAQFERFLRANRERIREVGGMVLIDDDPDYLSVAPDGSFRSRSRYQDPTTGEWSSETEVIESGAELIELYNPAEVYAAFAEAARAQAGLPEQPTAAEDLLETAGISTDAGVGIVMEEAEEEGEGEEEGEAWGTFPAEEPRDKQDAARLLYDLALTFQERSQRSEADLLEQFQESSVGLARVLGDSMILDDEDERLWYRSNGTFEAEVVPERSDEEAEGETGWKALTSADDMVQFYDPTDLFGDLAEALADQYPGVAPELEDDDD
jgi:hypothetical protein